MPIFLRRTMLLVLFATALAATWPACAAGAERETIRSQQAGERAVPEFFNRFLSFLRSVEDKPGCRLDPFGRCTPAQSPKPQRKEGCRIDPFGRCLP